MFVSIALLIIKEQFHFAQNFVFTNIWGYACQKTITINELFPLYSSPQAETLTQGSREAQTYILRPPS